MNELVSIIIPVYNRENLISKTLDSISNQTYSNWECIIVDDGSNDNTIEVLREYENLDKRFKYFERSDSLKKGAPSCRNLGYEKAKGEFIQWFDSDDLMLPDFLEAKVNKLSKDISLDFTVCKMGEFNTVGNNSYPSQTLISDDIFKDFITGEIKFFTPGPLFRKRFLANKPLFNINLRRHQEYELFSRLMMHNPKYEIIDSYLCLRRLHDDTINSKANNIFNRYWKITVFIELLKYCKKVPELSKSKKGSLYKFISEKSFLYIKISIRSMNLTIIVKSIYLFLLNKISSII